MICSIELVARYSYNPIYRQTLHTDIFFGITYKRTVHIDNFFFYASMHPMQLSINLYVFSYKSQCIYSMHAFYADIYKLVYILFYESMHLCYACILCSLIQTCIFFVLWVYGICFYAMYASCVINKYIKFHAIYEYMTLTICICIYNYNASLCI